MDRGRQFRFLMTLIGLLTWLAVMGIAGTPALAASKISIVYSAKVFNLSPVWIAMEQGFFEKRGLDVSFIQTGGAPESVAALVSGAVDAIAVVPPQDTQMIQRGFKLIADGTALRIPYIATGLATTRDTIAKRPDVL